MSLNRKYRSLAAGELSCLWRVGHRHVAPHGCEEYLSLRRLGAPSRRTLTFTARPGFLVPDGATSSAGCVRDDAGRWLNLNEPGVVRAFVDVLCPAAWPADDRRSLVLDGWAHFAEAHEKHRSRGRA